MSDIERRILKPHTKRGRIGEMIAAYSFGGLMLFTVLLGLTSFIIDVLLPWLGLHFASLDTTEKAAGCAIITLIVIGRYVLLDFRELSKESSITDPVARDIAKGIVLIETFTVRAVVEIEEFDDEGAGFFIELTDDRVLFVVGQHLYPYAHSPEPDPELLEDGQAPHFPADAIECTSAPDSGILLNFEGIGAYRKPRSRVRYNSKGPAGLALVDNAFYPGRIEDILAEHGFTEEPLRPST